MSNTVTRTSLPSHPIPEKLCLRRPADDVDVVGASPLDPFDLAEKSTFTL